MYARICLNYWLRSLLRYCLNNRLRCELGNWLRKRLNCWLYDWLNNQLNSRLNNYLLICFFKIRSNIVFVIWPLDSKCIRCYIIVYFIKDRNLDILFFIWLHIWITFAIQAFDNSWRNYSVSLHFLSNNTELSIWWWDLIE